jgi:hypothetical protein
LPSFLIGTQTGQGMFHHTILDELRNKWLI